MSWATTASETCGSSRAWAEPPPRRRRRHPASREEGKKSRNPQRFVRQVFLPVGLEVDAVGRLDLLLFPDRFLREAREARFDFGGQWLASPRLRVLEGLRKPEAGIGIFVSLAHLGEDARRG